MAQERKPGGIFHRPIGIHQSHETGFAAESNSIDSVDRCFSCGVKFYFDEPDCPQCGAAYPHKPRRKSWMGLLIIIIVLVKFLYLTVR